MLRAMMGKKKGKKLLEVRTVIYNGPFADPIETYDKPIRSNYDYNVTYAAGDTISSLVLCVLAYYGKRFGVCLNNTEVDEHYGSISTDSTTDTPPFIQDMVFDPKIIRAKWKVTIKPLSDFSAYVNEGKTDTFMNLIGEFKVVSVVQIE